MLDLESMLGERVDAYPATHNGTGDKLHFCQPGPADWAFDALVGRTVMRAESYGQRRRRR